MNSAITFPTAHDGNNFLSYTKATALSAGWVWQIPTQIRHGNGYVFCDKFISEENAIKEVEILYGHEINVGKRFKFNAGYLKNPWIKNCIAIGLSSSFIEPLEATNIGTAIQQSFGIIAHLNRPIDNKFTTEIYNKTFRKVFENIIDFVQLHYVTKRCDTDFWNYCQTLELTDFNKETLDLFKKHMPTWIYFKQPFTLFDHNNWAAILHGLELIDRDSYINQWKKLSIDTRLNAKVKMDIYNNRENITIDNKEALDLILKGYS